MLMQRGWFAAGRHIPKELPKFLLFGAISAGATLVAGWLLYDEAILRLPYCWAAALGAAAGMLVNFQLNYSFNFSFRCRSAWQQLISFFLVSGFGVFLTAALSELNWLIIGFFVGSRVSVVGISLKTTLVANVLAIGMVALYSFPAHKFVSFNVGPVKRLAQLGAMIVARFSLSRPVPNRG